jgi:hypothetical protein
MPDVLSPPAPKIWQAKESQSSRSRFEACDETDEAEAGSGHSSRSLRSVRSPLVITSRIRSSVTGTVTEIDDAKLTIAFAGRGTKQIVDYYVKRHASR